jgi:HSP20 family molecular chaperone IbpA
MTKVTVYNETGKGAIVNPLLLKIEGCFDAIQKRAFEMFEERGRGPGGEINDWLQAERDLFFVPAAEFAETDQGVTLKLAMPGFEGRNIDVMAGPNEIVVWAKSEATAADKAGTCCAAESRSVYRRFDVPAPIDASGVTAKFDKATLIIEAPKPDAQPVLIRSVAA